MNTRWTEQLQQYGARLDESGQISFLPSKEEVALAKTASIIVPLTHLGLIDAIGEEVSPFLHNLTSTNIKSLPAGRAQLSSLSGPKGRMLASFLLWRTTGGLRLALAADLHASILKKLGMYVLRAKVKLSDGGAERVLLGLSGASAVAALEASALGVPAGSRDLAQTGDVAVIRLADGRFVVDCPADKAEALWAALRAAGLQAAGTQAWQWLDIQAGIPLVSARTSDEFVAQMLNYELLGGVSFDKGCFPGQEIIARTQHLGKVKKRMFPAHLEAETEVLAGTDLYAAEFGEQSCGKVLTATPAPEGGVDMLVSLQLSVHGSGAAHLGSPDGPVLSFRPLPYAVD